MKRLGLIFVFLLAIPVVFGLLMKRVPPAFIGVKQINIGGAGIVPVDHPTGFHLGVTGYHKWYFLPRKTHFLHFSGSRATSRSKFGKSTSIEDWNEPLSLRTTDNNLVEVEISIPYRIKEGGANQIVQDGYLLSYRELVRGRVQGVLRAELAKLTSEDLQETDARISRGKETLPVLNKSLADFNVVAEDILIRRIGFQSQYEEKLQEKQYLSQKANLDSALTLQAEEEKKTNLIERQIQAAELKLTQNWEKKFQEEKSRYQVLIATIKAEAEVYSAKTRAEGEAEKVILEANGQLAVEKADALRNELRTAALATEGGDTLLALEAAANLNMPSVVLDSQNPAVPMILDLERMVQLLVGSGN